MNLAGWQLIHHEHIQIFQAIHRDGAHRIHFNLDTTIWLLLLRLLYAEQQEANVTRLARYPMVTIGEIIQRYDELPGARPRKKSSLEEALRHFQQLMLVRTAHGRSLRASNLDQIVELLPTLEVFIPSGASQQIAQQLAEYSTNRSGQAKSSSKNGEQSNDDDLVEDIDELA